jgi:hypothetical protein
MRRDSATTERTPPGLASEEMDKKDYEIAHLRIVARN